MAFVRLTVLTASVLSAIALLAIAWQSCRNAYYYDFSKNHLTWRSVLIEDGIITICLTQIHVPDERPIVDEFIRRRLEGRSQYRPRDHFLSLPGCHSRNELAMVSIACDIDDELSGSNGFGKRLNEIIESPDTPNTPQLIDRYLHLQTDALYYYAEFQNNDRKKATQYLFAQGLRSPGIPGLSWESRTGAISGIIGRVSIYYLLTLALIYPMIALLALRRRIVVARRRRRNRCGVCDYDLAGNISGICSECGTRVSQESNIQPVLRP